MGFLFYKARGRGYDIACRNNIGALSCAMSMYAESWNGYFPHKLEALYPDQVNDMNIFRGCRYHPSYKKDEGEFGLEYLPGLKEDCLPDSIMLFCKKSHRGEGRNVLYWPPRYGMAFPTYYGLITEETFQKELKRIMTSFAYRKQYTEEAIKIMEKYLEEK